MTSRELVDAVAAADLGEYETGRDDEFAKACNADYHARLRSFLADLGFDPLDYMRARRDVKFDDPDDYATRPTLNPRKRLP